MIILIQIISLVFISIILINLLIKFPISIAFPSKRGMHNTSIPSSGGLAILGSYVCVTSYAYLIHDHSLSMSSPIFSLILISLLGYADDKFKLSKFFRFISQAIISLIVLLSMSQLVIFELIIWLIFFLFFINIYNFMDGINGLATNQGIFVLISFIILENFYTLGSLILFIIPLTVFLFFNLSPSKIFLGNAGSYMLGLFISILFFKSTYSSNDIVIFDHIISALIILTIFIADSLYTLLARFLYKFQLSHRLIESCYYITTPHSVHNYQIITKKYKSHNKVNLFLMAYNYFWCLPLAFLCSLYSEYSLVMLIISYLPYLIYCYKNDTGKE